LNILLFLIKSRDTQVLGGLVKECSLTHKEEWQVYKAELQVAAKSNDFIVVAEATSPNCAHVPQGGGTEHVAQ